MSPASASSSSGETKSRTRSGQGPSSSSKTRYKPGPKSKKKFLNVESTSSSTVEGEGEVQFNLVSSPPSVQGEVKLVDLEDCPVQQRDDEVEMDTQDKQEPCSNGNGIKHGHDEEDEEEEHDDLFIEKKDPSPSSDTEDDNSSPPNGQEEDEEEGTTEDDGEEGGETLYEIEEILDYVNESHGVGEMYYVKWKDWSADFNTWEPAENVTNCFDALYQFFVQRKADVEKQIASQVYIELPNGKRRKSVKSPEIWKIPPDPRPLQERLDAFYTATKPLCNIKLLEKYVWWIKNKKANVKRNKWPTHKVNKFLMDGADGKLSKNHESDFRKELYYVEAEKHRAIMDKKLGDWEKAINKVTQNRPVIKVENDVDFEGPPADFKYVSNYIPAAGITIPNDPPIWCECCSGDGSSCYDNKKNCCAKLSNGRFAYNRFKKVDVPIGSPIWECNSKCTCGPDCVNRVVQDGSTDEVSLCIFRTDNGCGWGVKALKSIKKGSFVCLYVGDLILSEEAERRSREDPSIQPYLFDLDFVNLNKPVYTVDASRKGNVSHFINHSCDPNLGVYTVFVDCLDINMPKLAMFTLRKIERGEELSFDYLNQSSREEEDSDTKDGDEDSSAGEKSPPEPQSPTKSGKQRTQRCLCAAANCRKFLYA